MNKMTKVERIIAIISLSLSSIAFGFYLGQVFMMHGYNYSEQVGIFPGLVIVLGFLPIYFGMKASKRKEKQ